MNKINAIPEITPFCNCQKCDFYLSGTEYHPCGLPAYLRKGFQLRDADKIRNTIENCHCKSAAAGKIYATLKSEKEETV